MSRRNALNLQNYISSDVDECSDSSLNKCQENATCTNTIGGYTCTCNNGLEGNGTSCTGNIAYLKNLVGLVYKG